MIYNMIYTFNIFFIVIFIFYLQGWLLSRNGSERDIILNLFDSSFGELLRYAVQNLVFKMDVLEAFIIKQVIAFLLSCILYY